MTTTTIPRNVSATFLFLSLLCLLPLAQNKAQCPATLPPIGTPPTEVNCPLRLFDIDRAVGFATTQSVTTQIWSPNTNPPACCLISPANQPHYNAPNGPFNLLDINGMPTHRFGIGTFVTTNSIGVVDAACGNLPNSFPAYLGSSVEQVQQDGWLILPQGITCIRFRLKSPDCGRADAAALWLGNSITSMIQVGVGLNSSGLEHDYIIPPDANDICGFKVMRMRYYSYDSDAFSNTILSWDLGDGNGFVNVTTANIQSMGPNQNPDSDDNMPTMADVITQTTKTVRDADGEYFEYDAATNTFTGVLLDPFDVDTDDEGAADACIIATEIFPDCPDYQACIGDFCPTTPVVDITPTACNYITNQTIDATPTNQPSYITNYTYNWSDGSSLATLTPTVAGTYTVTITANYDWHTDNIIDLSCPTVVWAEAYDPITLTDHTDRCGSINTIDVSVTGGQPQFLNDLTQYSFTSNLAGNLGMADANGNINLTNMSCGTHEITASYEYLDPYNNLANTSNFCSEMIAIEVYDELMLQSQSPACGEIDIDNITGGWDPNCADFATPSIGYMITITGPNNSALTSPANYVVGPLTSFAGTEFQAGQNGVPLNGLPGGNYTITVDDGRNNACLDQFSIDINGCCPAAIYANTDYQLCGLNQPILQPATGQNTLPTTTPTIGDLPDLSINSSATNLLIDLDTDLTLNLNDVGSGQDATGDGVDWYLGADPFNDIPYSDAAMVSDGICQMQQYTIYAFLRCDGNHDGNFAPTQIGTNPQQEVGFDAMGMDSYIPAGQVTVSIWPEIAVPDISYPNNPVECQVNLENPCPDVYELEVTDDDGNNYIADNSSNSQMLFLGFGNQYTYDGLATPNVGTIGDLTLTITNPAAIAAFNNGNADPDNVGCSEVTFERPYVCCLAEAGVMEVGNICSDPSQTNTDLAFTIYDFRGDASLSPQLPNYCTYLLITEQNTGNICGTIEVACTDGTGLLATDNRPISIPYSDFAALYCGTGINYDFYTYNYFLSNPPANNNLPFGVATGTATNISDVVAANSPEEGCYDLSFPDELYIPNVMAVDCNSSINQGNNGGISPLYFNVHEICVSGGTPPYNYIWDTRGYVRHAIIGNNGFDTDKIKIIYADNASWYVTVYDANGCTYTDWSLTNESIGSSLLEIDNYTITNANIQNACSNGSISIQVNGGVPPYNIAWTGPITWGGTINNNGTTVSNAPVGWYQATVMDSAVPANTTTGWYWMTCKRPGRGKEAGIKWLNDVVMYPNPAQDKIYIKNLTDGIIQQMLIIDVTGQIVWSGLPNNNSIDVSALPTGIYLVNIMTDLGSVVEKIVVER